MSNPERLYWDSCTYIDYLRGDHPLRDAMSWIIEDWRAGKVEIVTSALTIAEVLWVKCAAEERARSLIDRPQDEAVVALFDPPEGVRFILVELSRVTARRARQLVWEQGIRPKDAIHVASALEAHCPVMHTNDTALLKRSTQVGGQPVLRIEAPQWVHEPRFPLDQD